MLEGFATWLGPAEWAAVRLSIRVSFWATLASLPFGILAAHALARWEFPGRQLLNGLVHLPLILPGIIAGAILAFARAIGEFGATISFVSNIPGQTQTIPSVIYAFLQVPGGQEAASRLVIVAIVIAMAALLLSELVARRVARMVAGT
jgi:ABC-type molybdate transport system permease subunit